MQKVNIAVVYHSGYGHTRQISDLLAERLKTEHSEVSLLSTEAAISQMDILHQADTIVFGSPTYYGTVSAGFKSFMEATGTFWYKQPWKDKLAAGFTNSSTTNGDKLNTLTTLSLFAAQHSMIWISQGILPRYINDRQTDGQNRMASYLGLMVQSDNNLKEINPMHPGDMLTTELFAERILKLTLQFKSSNQLSITNKN